MLNWPFKSGRAMTPELAGPAISRVLVLASEYSITLNTRRHCSCCSQGTDTRKHCTALILALAPAYTAPVKSSRVLALAPVYTTPATSMALAPGQTAPATSSSVLALAPKYTTLTTLHCHILALAPGQTALASSSSVLALALLEPQTGGGHSSLSSHVYYTATVTRVTLGILETPWVLWVSQVKEHNMPQQTRSGERDK